MATDKTEKKQSGVFPLAHLDRLHWRITRAIQNGRGITLSPRDLDLLTAAGGYDILSSALAAELKKEALERIEAAMQDPGSGYEPTNTC